VVIHENPRVRTRLDFEHLTIDGSRGLREEFALLAHELEVFPLEVGLFLVPRKLFLFWCFASGWLLLLLLLLLLRLDVFSLIWVLVLL